MPDPPADPADIRVIPFITKLAETPDLCEGGTLPPDDPRSLACDWGGRVRQHYCLNPSWRPDVQAVLDAARTVAELREAWLPLEDKGAVDGIGGAEYHHALAHLRVRHDKP